MSTDIVPVDFNAELDRVADPGEFVIATVDRAKAWLAAALDHGDIERILEIKSQADAMRTYVMAKQLGKDAEMAASEIVRRAERGIGQAIRKGQEAGEILKRGDVGGIGGKGIRGADPDRSRESDLPRPADFLSTQELGKVAYPLTDGVSDEDFEEALAGAKAEENLSRANLLRKIKPKESKSVNPPVRTQIASAAGQRRVLAAACLNLSGVAHGLRLVEDLHPDITSEEAAQWVGGLSEARLAIERVIKRLKERTNNGA